MTGTLSQVVQSDKPCERPGWPWNISISIQSVWVSSEKQIERKQWK